HLIAGGADPRAFLLLTFSRRAAHEMTRRGERLIAALASARGLQSAATLLSAGTFHSIGARLLREFAARIGINPAFPIHDPEGSPDLMNRGRHDCGFAATRNRFPLKSTCLAIYSRVVNTQDPLERVLGTLFPWCAAWANELRTLFATYVEAKQ